MTEDDLASLRRAVASVEHPGLAARLTNMVGKPIDGRLARGTFVSTFGFTAHHSVRKDRAMAARANVRSVVSDAQDKGREAVEAVSEVRDNVAVAIDKSLKRRPYTTLALTLALGFLLGAIWAR